jgi:hypothetical protein
MSKPLEIRVLRARSTQLEHMHISTAPLPAHIVAPMPAIQRYVAALPAFEASHDFKSETQAFEQLAIQTRLPKFELAVSEFHHPQEYRCHMPEFSFELPEQSAIVFEPLGSDMNPVELLAALADFQGIRFEIEKDALSTAGVVHFSLTPAQVHHRFSEPVSGMRALPEPNFGSSMEEYLGSSGADQRECVAKKATREDGISNE